MTNWVGWHEAYDDPESALSLRRRLVQGHLRDALERYPADCGVRLVSCCAGTGLDVIEVAAKLVPGRLRARLVELDPELARRGATAAAEIEGVEMCCGDASTTSAYDGAVPADIVMMCGVFGNIDLADIEATIAELPRLCAPGATVIWTRHRREPSAIDAIDGFFATAGFDVVTHDAPAALYVGVGVHRLAGEPLPYRSGVTMFTMTGDGR